MGGCASKPKGDNEAAAAVPEPLPVPTTEKVDSSTAVIEAKEIGTVKAVEEEAKVGGGDDYKDKEIVDDEKGDEQGNRRKSLSNLFKENEEKEESTESDKTTSREVPLEPAKEEGPVKDQESMTANDIVVTNTSVQETEKVEKPFEETPVPVVVVASKTIEIENTTEAAPSGEAAKLEKSEEKEKEEEKRGIVDDAKVAEESSKNDSRQQTSVLPVSSTEAIAGEAKETK